MQGSKVKALVDTGASDCFMSKEMREKLPLETVVDTWRVDKGKIHLADDSYLTILEQVRVKFKLSGARVCYDFNVVNNLCQLMVIGRNFLTAVKADLSFPGPNCEIFGGNPISVVHEIDVPPNSEMILPVRPWQPMDRDDQGTYCNPASKAQVMGRVAKEAVEEMVESIIPESSEVLENDQPSEDIDLSQSCLSEEEKTQFRKMLKHNRNSLAFTMAELGECKLIPMVIKVDESEGIVASRPYRNSLQKMDIIDEQVKQLLDLGVVEPSESAWRSPLVVVQKKDGKPRLCTDFRMLNMITRKDKFPMPTARSLFLYMAYKIPTIWSALDLLSGYHQCNIERCSREYTAFETPFYHYRRVPFGLIGAPWHFTKVMAIALRGLIPRVCLAYLDDVIVYDTSFSEHLRSAEMVLKALANAGLKLKPAKCEWCRDEIRFLGHVVNAQGVQKVQAFNRPHSQKTVKSFLGLCNYYRAFVPNFPAIANPLNKLLRKDIPFEWTDKCEEAFLIFKEALTSAPLLIHPDIGGHFHVLTDASDTACSAAVCHRMNDLYHPVAYWGTTLKDALAVIRCLKEYEDMLQGAKVTIVTDHRPLVPLLQKAYKAPSAQLKRWALALTDFDYAIKYEPGTTHFLPDYLSTVQTVVQNEPEFKPEVGCELLEMELSGENLLLPIL